MRTFKLKPIVNKANGQINFNLKKTSLPEKFKDKLPTLKSINIDLDDFEFEDL